MLQVCSRDFAKVKTKTPRKRPKYIEARSIVMARKNVDRTREEKKEGIFEPEVLERGRGRREQSA
jgi:hypothetical protein